MKKSLIRLLCLCLGLSCLPLSGCGKEEEIVENYVEIAVLEPLTGDDSLQGNRERLGIEYARAVRREAVIGGESYTVRLVEKDTASSIEEAVYAARELAKAGSVSVALGSYGSSACCAIAPELAEAGISAIGITCTEPSITTAHSNYYRVCYLDDYQAKLLAQYAIENGCHVAYCLAQTDRDYDRAMCNAFIEEFTARGGSVVTTVTSLLYNTYSTTLLNFNDYLYGAVNAYTDVLFAPIPAAKGAQLIQECEAYGVKFSLLSDATWDTAIVGEAGLDTYMDVAFASLFAWDQNDATRAFTIDFQDWLNADPRRVEANGGTDEVFPASALAYDAYMAAIEAIEAAGSTEPEKVGAALGGVRFTGVTGKIAFDEYGDLDRGEMSIKGVDDRTGTVYFKHSQQEMAPLTSAEE